MAELTELTRLKIKDLTRALHALQGALVHPDDDRTIVRDSSLLRFSLVYELTTKTMSLVLFDRFGVDEFGPKTVYREAHRMGLLDETQTEIALRMVNDRNRMIHDYSEGFSNELFERVQREYTPLFAVLLERFQA